MKILRSQYLKLQCNAENQHNFSHDRVEKMIPSKGKKRGKGKQELGLTAAPARLLGKNEIVCFKENSSRPAKNIKILIENVDGALKKLNVVLEYVDMSALWLTNLYKTYENDLWRKKPFLDIQGNKKWIYYCALCSNYYRKFYSLKCHLNLHLNVYPYVCKICLKRYTGRKSATEHIRKLHHIERQQYNDYLTS